MVENRKAALQEDLKKKKKLGFFSLEKRRRGKCDQGL